MRLSRNSISPYGLDAHFARVYTFGVRCISKLIAVITALLILPLTAIGSGWNDYDLDIGSGFYIFRANSFEVCLGKEGRSLIICPLRNESSFGPITGYFFTEKHLLIKATGAKPHPKNDSVFIGDSKKIYYFIVDKTTSEKIGPLAVGEFLEQVKPLDTVDWIRPKNPNFWTPLLGNIMFLLLAAVFMGWPIVLFIVVIYLIYRLIQQRKKGVLAKTT